MTIRPAHQISQISQIQNPRQTENGDPLTNKITQFLDSHYFCSYPISIKSFLKRFLKLVQEKGFHVGRVFTYGEEVLQILRNDKSNQINIGIEIRNAADEDFFNIISKLPVSSLCELSEGNLKYSDIFHSPEYFFKKFLNNSCLTFSFHPVKLQLVLIRTEFRADTLERCEVELKGENLDPYLNVTTLEMVKITPSISVELNTARILPEGLFRYCSLISKGYISNIIPRVEIAYMQGFSAEDQIESVLKPMNDAEKKTFLLNMERVVYCAFPSERKKTLLQTIRKILFNFEEIQEEQLIYASPKFFKIPFNPSEYYLELEKYLAESDYRPFVYRDQELQLARAGIELHLEGCPSLPFAFWEAKDPQWKVLAIQKLPAADPSMPEWIDQFLAEPSLSDDELLSRLEIVSKIVKENPDLESRFLEALKNYIFLKEKSISLTKKVLEYVIAVSRQDSEHILDEIAAALKGQAFLDVCHFLMQGKKIPQQFLILKCFRRHLPTPSDFEEHIKEMPFLKKICLFMYLDLNAKCSSDPKAPELIKIIATKVQRFSQGEKLKFLKKFKHPAFVFFMAHFQDFHPDRYLARLEQSLPGDPRSKIEFLEKQEFLLYLVGRSLNFKEGILKGLLTSESAEWRTLGRQRLCSNIYVNVQQKLQATQYKRAILESLFEEGVLTTIEILNMFQSLCIPPLESAMLEVLKDNLKIFPKIDLEITRSLFWLVSSMHDPKRIAWVTQLFKHWGKNAIFQYADLLTLGLRPNRPDLFETQLVEKTISVDRLLKKVKEERRGVFLLNLQRIYYCSSDEENKNLINVLKVLEHDFGGEGNLYFMSPCLFQNDYTSFVRHICTLDRYLLREQELHLARQGHKISLTKKGSFFENLWATNHVNWQRAALSIATEEEKKKIFHEINQNISLVEGVLEAASPQLFFELLKENSIPKECQTKARAKFSLHFSDHLELAIEAEKNVVGEKEEERLSVDLLKKIFELAKVQSCLSLAAELFIKEADRIKEYVLLESFSLDPRVALVVSSFSNHKFQKEEYSKKIGLSLSAQKDQEKFIAEQKRLLQCAGVPFILISDLLLHHLPEGSQQISQILDVLLKENSLVDVFQRLQKWSVKSPFLKQEIVSCFEKNELNFKGKKLIVFQEFLKLIKKLPWSQKRMFWVQEIDGELRKIKDQKNKQVMQVAELLREIRYENSDTSIEVIEHYLINKIDEADFEEGARMFELHIDRLKKLPFSKFTHIFFLLLPHFSVEKTLKKVVDHIASSKDQKKIDAFMTLSTMMGRKFSVELKVHLMRLIKKEVEQLTSKQRNQYAHTMTLILEEFLMFDLGKTEDGKSVGEEGFKFFTALKSVITNFKPIAHRFQIFVCLNWKWLQKKDVLNEVFELYQNESLKNDQFSSFIDACSSFLKESSQEDRMEFFAFLNRIDLKKAHHEVALASTNGKLISVLSLKDSEKFLSIHGECFETIKKYGKDEKIIKENMSRGLAFFTGKLVENCKTIKSIKYLEDLFRNGLENECFTFDDLIKAYHAIVKRHQEMGSLESEKRFFEENKSLIKALCAGDPSYSATFGVCAFHISGKKDFAINDFYEPISQIFSANNVEAQITSKTVYIMQQMLFAYLYLAETTTDSRLQVFFVDRAAFLFKKLFNDSLSPEIATIALKFEEDTSKIIKSALYSTFKIPAVSRLENRPNVENVCHRLLQIAFTSGRLSLYEKLSDIRASYYSSACYREDGIKVDKPKQELGQPPTPESIPEMFRIALPSFPVLVNGEIEGIAALLNLMDSEEGEQEVEVFSESILKFLPHFSIEGCFTIFKVLLQSGENAENRFYRSIIRMVRSYSNQTDRLAALWHHLSALDLNPNPMYGGVALAIMSSLRDWHFWKDNREKIVPFLDEKAKSEKYLMFLNLFLMLGQFSDIREELQQGVEKGWLGPVEAIRIYKNWSVFIIKNGQDLKEQKEFKNVYEFLQQNLGEKLNEVHQTDLALIYLMACLAGRLNKLKFNNSLVEIFEIVKKEVSEEARQDNPIASLCMFELLKILLESEQNPEIKQMIGWLFSELFFKAANLSHIELHKEINGEQLFQIADSKPFYIEIDWSSAVNNLLELLASYECLDVSSIFEEHFIDCKDNFCEMRSLYESLPIHFPDAENDILLYLVIHMHYLLRIDAYEIAPVEQFFHNICNAIDEKAEISKSAAKCCYHTVRYFLDLAKNSKNIDEKRDLIEKIEYLIEQGLMRYKGWSQLSIAERSSDDSEVFLEDIFERAEEDRPIDVASLLLEVVKLKK